MLGILMALIVTSGRWVRLGMGPAAVLALGAFVALKYTSILYTIVAVSAVPLALVVAAGATADAEARPSPFRGRVALWLGEASFAFYLLHQLVLTYGHRALGLGRTWSTRPPSASWCSCSRCPSRWPGCSTPSWSARAAPPRPLPPRPRGPAGPAPVLADDAVPAASAAEETGVRSGQWKNRSNRT
ncbi:hypothetical protein NKH77_47260 [Streptomyces sp. M19]